MIKLLLFLLLFSNYGYSQLSYGDGSESCNWSTSPSPKREYNCSSLNVTGTVTFPGISENIIIRVQGDVDISGILSVSADGITAGPGGIAVGGTLVGGEGSDGAYSNTGGGGGGAGGRMSSDAPVAGSDGDNSAASGGAISVTTYGEENSFSETLPGGSPGGSGGIGDDSGTPGPGGQGGAGSGSIIIIANGDINISGSITANGGQGEDGPANGGGLYAGGGGGAGSGGAIYLIGNTVSITGSVTASGGIASSGGAGLAENGGAGGSGGQGRIRIDTSSGSFTGVTTPTADTNILPTIIDPLFELQSFESAIEYGCTYKVKEEYGFILPYILGLLLVLIILQIPMVFRRRQY